MRFKHHILTPLLRVPHIYLLAVDIFHFLFLVVMRGLWDLNFQTRGGTEAPCSRNVDSKPLDFEGSPGTFHFIFNLDVLNSCYSHKSESSVGMLTKYLPFLDKSQKTIFFPFCHGKCMDQL